MEINTWLRENSEEQYQKFSQNIIKSKYPILGIRIPKLREKAKEIAKEYGLEGSKLLNEESFECLMLQGFVIAYSKNEFFEKEKYIYEYLLKTDNWSHIDSFAATFKPKNNEKNKIWEFIISCCEDKHDQVVRYGLVSIIDNFIDESHINEIIKICSKLKNKSQLIEMANGWLLATAYIDFPEKVISIINELDQATYRYAKGKIHDSYRISKEDKKQFDEVNYDGNR